MYAFFGHNKINKLEDDLFLNSPLLRTIDFSQGIFCKSFIEI